MAVGEVVILDPASPVLLATLGAHDVCNNKLLVRIAFAWDLKLLLSR
jgi:hypothetical protein